MSTSSHPLDSPLSAAVMSVQSQALAVSVDTYAEVARLGIGEQFPEAIALTSEIFGEFLIDISNDPEIDDCSYVTFNVRSDERGSFAKESEWIRRLPRCPTGAAGSFCLSIDIFE
jgi:hypothetical protein